MSRADLTRWNRARLARFRYVDGNAATHLEDLRRELADRFHQWLALQYVPPHRETVAERTARLLTQYHAEPRDWAWETTRAFARGLHILTEHIDAFANESYLRTATQDQSVHRLAAMVGYAPAPASSATTPLVLLARADADIATVARGSAVRYSPAGAAPIVFETLEDIDVAPALNALRLQGWNSNPRPLSADEVKASAWRSAKAPLWPLPATVRAGAAGLALLAAAKGADAIPVWATPVMDGTAVTLDLLPPLVSLPAGLTVGTALLHVAPSRLVPRPNGTGVVRVTAPHGLAPGDVVAWKAEDLSIQFAGVLEAAGAVLRLQPAPGAKVPPKESTPLVRAAAISRAQFAANNLEWRLPDMTRSGDFRVTFAAGDGALHAGLAESDLGVDEPLTADNKPSGYVRLTAAALSSARQIWFADPGTDKPATIVRAVSFDTTRTLEFDGKPPALAIDDVVILETPEGDVPAHVNRIAAIDRDAGGYRLTMAADLPPQPVAAVHAGFAATLRPRDHDVDLTPLAGDTLDLDLNSDPAGWSLLRHNRRLVLGSASGAFAPFLARIVTADPQAGSIRIDRPLDPAQVTRGDLIIRANVVNAGHGETKPDRVLGSGDASAIHQRFLIDADDVSHVRDVSMPAGVRADIRVEAEREIYSQVATLRDSTPSDPHYVARVTATGALELEFGDGRHGRRLPTGANNVSARIRRGAGLAGNLPAGKLTDIVKKHPAIDAILQPIAASGGDDREAVDQIRQNAPRRLIAMDRAISVADYQHLVERFQGVWHAVALEQAEFSRSRAGLRLVVVPAGGGALGELAGQISDYLAASGLPSVAIAVEPFVALAANIAVDVRVASRRFDPTDVQERVRAALLAAFDLRRRRPGQPLDRSEVIGIVENTVGVSHCDVVKFATAAASPGDRAAGSSDGTIWTLFPLDNEVIYAADPAQVTVTIAEATR